jgi:2-polyprenyl-6-methoxyphenol hydroxylase-like FAD-dependent oxidoreductase
MRLKKL